MQRSKDHRFRVIQWATGRVGLPALQGIVNHPHLELVGLYVSSKAKAGRDAGELFGGEPTGVVATDDVSAMLATPADCVVYCATDVDRIDAVVDDLEAILLTGMSVVNTSVTRLVWPSGEDPDVVARLERACRLGGSTLYNTGIHPGVVSDQLLLAASNISQGIEKVSVAEMYDCSSYDPAVLGAYGFGRTREQDADEFDPGLVLYFWEPVVRSLAEHFELELEQIDLFRRPTVVEDAHTTSAGLEIGRGTIGALHFGLEGVADGATRIVVESYLTTGPGVHPADWPAFPVHDGRAAGGHRIAFTGVPSFQVDVAYGHPTDPLTDVLIGTGMRAVNSIAAVVEAPPGVVMSFADLPYVQGFLR